MADLLKPLLPGSPEPPASGPAEATSCPFVCGKPPLPKEDAASATPSAPWGPWDPRPHVRAIFCRGAAGRSGASFAPLDGLRALAWAWVCSYHLLTHKIFSNGWWAHYDVAMPTALTATIMQGAGGVSVFFVLSGFLISHVFHGALARRRRLGDARLWRAWAEFVHRRFWRVWPAYIVSLLVCFRRASQCASRADLWRVLRVAGLFTANLAPAHRSDCEREVTAVAWTVSVEFQLYLATPLFVSLHARRPRAGVAAAAAVMLASLASRARTTTALDVYGEHVCGSKYSASCEAFERLYYHTWYRCNEYFVGVLAHCLHVECARRPGGRAARWTAAATGAPAQLVAFGGFGAVLGWLMWCRLAQNGHYDAALAWAYYVLKFWLLAASTAYIIAGTVVAPRPALLMRALRAALGSACVYPFASLSYTAYLFQSLAEYPDDWLGFAWPKPVSTAAGWLGYAALFLLLDAAVGLALALAVERPMMVVGRRVEAALDRRAAPLPSRASDSGDAADASAPPARLADAESDPAAADPVAAQALV